MLRLFTAIELPEDTRRRLAALARPLPGTAWVKPENMHLTLSFIGEVDEGLAADIDIELARISQPSFEIALAGVDQFESRARVRAIWVGVERAPALMALQAKVESALKRAGASPEIRRYTPHVTLARFHDLPIHKVAPFIAQRNHFREGPIAVEGFSLMSSRLGHAGAVYTVERRYPLLGAGIRALAEEWARQN
ncbi:MAG: RNA 2',3'-cyclic phosphodiesterase [Alphaproteobacteria bacterium]|nr:RNA 2',3'-cyclic phosphodiesterase [Alphaproteobacteria bacterium]